MCWVCSLLKVRGYQITGLYCNQTAWALHEMAHSNQPNTAVTIFSIVWNSVLWATKQNAKSDFCIAWCDLSPHNACAPEVKKKGCEQPIAPLMPMFHACAFTLPGHADWLCFRAQTVTYFAWISSHLLTFPATSRSSSRAPPKHNCSLQAFSEPLFIFSVVSSSEPTVWSFQS
jgi:hypothetical protein